MTTEHDDKNLVSRRGFLTGVVVAAVASVGAAIATPLVGYFLDPVLRKQPNQAPLKIAAASDITVGTPTFVKFQKTIQDGWVATTQNQGLWVVTNDGKNFVVFDQHCTHLGCLYEWDTSKNSFYCPCHGGVFDIDGNVIGGPPPRPLDRIPCQVVNGGIEITGIA